MFANALAGDLPALARALQDETIAGAALDAARDPGGYPGDHRERLDVFRHHRSRADDGRGDKRIVSM
jgi:hypothetical protein